MSEIYHKLAGILDSRERKLALFILFLTIIVAVIEVLGVASIMPFMAVLSNPEVIKTNSFLLFIYNFLNFQSTDAFLFFLGVCVLIFLVGSTFLKAFIVWAQVYFANLRNYSISARLVSGYLQQPYQWFLLRNSSTLAASVLNEVSRSVHGSLYPAMRLISNGLIAIFLFVLLTLADPILAISVVLVIGTSYGTIFKFAGKRLTKKGTLISEAQHNRLKAVNEAFGGIKDVKILGLEKFFIERYRVPARRMALSNISAKLWSEMPAFGMQALIFGGMMAMILYLMKTRGGLEGTIPVIALYALGVYKLMPALQEIYKQLAEIKFNQPALDTVYKDINHLNSLSPIIGDDKPLGISKSIELKKLQFSYPETGRITLDDISLTIKKNTTVGFVGSSGSGKTTTVDIILGLLQPDQGGVFVDNQKIDNHNLRSWQRSLGYVPQHIFLSDDSIASNIAFGVPSHEIDYTTVEKVARTANLHEFITNELQEGYNTYVGERGIRLSGGQRQRIGIARAIYHDPDILILDEATSALDNITEKAVMDAVREIGHKKTIIIVAHRLSTVQSCDKLFLFEEGKIAASGSHEELVNASSTFREMALIQNNI